jgi:hypothetical protein
MNAAEGDPTRVEHEHADDREEQQTTENTVFQEEHR